MNATPPVSSAFIPDAGPTAAAAAIQSSPLKPAGPTFAGTLKDVGARAARKPAAAGVGASKTGSGEPVPSSGNAMPPSPQPAASKAAAPAPAAPPSLAASPSPANVPGDQPGSVAPGSDAPAGAVAAGPALSTAVAVAQPVNPLPSGVAAAGATSLDTVVAAPQVTAAPSAISAAPGNAPSNGVAKGSAGPLRPSFKAALQPPSSAVNAADESEGDDAAGGAVPGTGPIAASAAPTPATLAATSSAPPAADSSAAAALAALAGSRSALSTAADATNDATNDPGTAVLGASAVAGASLTDAALEVSAASAAAVTATTAQATLLQGVVRADKHASAMIDAPSSGGADAAAGLSQLGSSAGTAPETAPAPPLRVAVNVDSTEFPQDLSARVSWMVDNNIDGAKLQVNPPQLGPIELRILVSGDHAQVWMSTHSAVTRDALESSTPKLREMLGTQGFSHVSVDISQRSFQERSAYSQPYEQTSAGRSGTAAAAAASAPTPNSIGLVDAYA